LPLSLILYLFYNADILEINRTIVSYTIKGGYINNINILVSSKDTTKTIKKLTATTTKYKK
jgi:hypothetical protein